MYVIIYFMYESFHLFNIEFIDQTVRFLVYQFVKQHLVSFMFIILKNNIQSTRTWYKTQKYGVKCLKSTIYED